MALERELATFAKQREGLLAASEGRFALIVGERLVGTYASYDDALQEGYKVAGIGTPFLVKAITRIEAAAHFTRPLVTCQA